MKTSLPFSVPSSSRFARTRWVVLATVIGLIAGMLTAGGAAASASADPTGSISGTVYGADAPATGLANAYVTLYAPNEEPVVLGNADQNGNFSFSGVAAGTYTLDFQSPDGADYIQQWWNNEPSNSAADYFTLADGQALGGMNATLAVGTTLSGSIYGAGSPNVPLSGASVFLQDPDGSFFAFGNTDSNGDYTISGVPAGTYTLQFTPPFRSPNYLQQWWNDQPTQATATTLTVGTAQTLTGYNAVLSVGASISGTVTGADTGQGVLNASVQALQDGSFAGFANVASDGSYTISGLAPGNYTLQFVPSYNTDYLGQYWKDAATAATATTVT
ncbi:MAG TPA: carboxypeptidase-like regulatory domain-containing protein, partial [Galbitalea sp.]